MIVTLTPNPSIDRTVSVPELLHGEVNRATGSRIDPGGKGINIARALTNHGAEALAVLPLGGLEGRLMEELLESVGAAYRPVPVDGTTRMNVTVVEPDGTTTKLNEPGPTLSTDELEALHATTEKTLREGADWVVGCGTLTPGAPERLYADLARYGHAAGARVAIDTSGVPLAAAVSANPDLIKPNREELEELVGTSLSTLGEIREAIDDLVAGGLGAALVSLGEHGALLVAGDVVAHASTTIGKPVSTVGAGDALLAGYLHALTRDEPPDQALATGVAWGAVAVGLPGSQMPTPEDVAEVSVTVTMDPDPTLGLS